MDSIEINLVMALNARLKPRSHRTNYAGACLKHRCFASYAPALIKRCTNTLVVRFLASSGHGIAGTVSGVETANYCGDEPMFGGYCWGVGALPKVAINTGRNVLPLVYCVPPYFGFVCCVPPFFSHAYCVPFNNKNNHFGRFHLPKEDKMTVWYMHLYDHSCKMLTCKISLFATSQNKCVSLQMLIWSTKVKRMS